MRMFIAVVLALGAVGCAGGGAPLLRELQRTTVGGLDVVILSADEVTQGSDTLVLEFRTAGGSTLQDVGTVRIAASMPMAGMAPMMGFIDVARTETPGRYALKTDLSMAGGWQLQIDWDGPAGKGAARLQQSVM